MANFMPQYYSGHKGFKCWRGAMEGNVTITNGFSSLLASRNLIRACFLRLSHSREKQIPASFMLELKRENVTSIEKQRIKLLDTEKLIFKTENLDFQRDQVGMHILVTVEPHGVVAIPSVQERNSIIFNIAIQDLSPPGPSFIRKPYHRAACSTAVTGVSFFSMIISGFVAVCDELLVGIPHKAWGVGVLVIICLILAFIIPYFLPSWLLQTNQTLGSVNQHVSKNS